jgi:hypothetical protein
VPRRGRSRRPEGREASPGPGGLLALGLWAAAVLLAAPTFYLVPGPLDLYVAPIVASLASLAAEGPLVGAAAAGLGSLTAYGILAALAVHAAGASRALRLVGGVPLVLGALHSFFIASGLAVVLWHAWRRLRSRQARG